METNQATGLRLPEVEAARAAHGSNALPQPQDTNNHLIDAMRYALEEDMDSRRASTASRAALGL